MFERICLNWAKWAGGVSSWRIDALPRRLIDKATFSILKRTRVLADNTIDVRMMVSIPTSKLCSAVLTAGQGCVRFPLALSLSRQGWWIMNGYARIHIFPHEVCLRFEQIDAPGSNGQFDRLRDRFYYRFPEARWDRLTRWMVLPAHNLTRVLNFCVAEFGDKGVRVMDFTWRS